jgi:hypothetical protein
MQPRLLVHDLRSIDATRFGAPLRASPLDVKSGPEAAVLVAPIVGEAYALGAFQRVRSAIDMTRLEGSGCSLVRRVTGGPAIRIGRGQVYLALDLRTPAALGGVADPARALNRHVRPLLRALTGLGDVPATSGGRDVVLMRGEPVAWVSVRHLRASGRTALEAVVAVTKSFEVPAEVDLAHGAIAPRWAGRHPTTVSAALGRTVTAEEVVEAILSAYVATADTAAQKFEPPALPASRVDPDETPFVAMVEEAVGLVGGVVERDRLVIGGDLIASEDVLRVVGDRLHELGPEVDDAQLGAVFDAALGPSSGSLLLGVRELSSFTKLVRATWAATKNTARGA